MPGSWEQQLEDNSPYVTIGIPHREITHVRWAVGLSRLIKTPRSAFSISKGHPWDITRNGIAQDALNNGSSHLLFLDSDVEPPVDGLMRLLAHNLPVVSGLYYCRHRSDYITPESLPIPLPVTPAMWLDNQAGAYTPIISWNPAAPLVQCDVAGAGFLLIHTSVFKRLDKDLDRKGNYFKWTAGVKDEEYTEHLPGVSEDFFFCRMLKKLGIPLYVDTTVECNHLSMAGVINKKGLDFSGI